MTSDDFWDDPIFRYTHLDALRDGMLHDVSEPARSCARLPLPTAITHGLWQTVAPGEPFNLADARIKEILYGLLFASVRLIPATELDTGVSKALCYRIQVGSIECPIKAVAYVDEVQSHQLGLVCTIMLQSED